jgi:hypothetical protein
MVKVLRACVIEKSGYHLPKTAFQMFTVKATYRGETRKLTFPECQSRFPSYDELYRQLYRVFPISRSIVLSKLLFSPDASQSRVLVSTEIRTAEAYDIAVAPFTGSARSWTSPMLRFSVSDETPHKVPAISQPVASNPQKPIVSNPFPIVEPSFGRISYSHIPPPPIIFSSRPSPQEPLDTSKSGKAEMKDKSNVPQTEYSKMQGVASCCAVTQAKQDIQELIAGFKTDLDRVIVTFGDHLTKEIDQSENALPRQLTPPTHKDISSQLSSSTVVPPFGVPESLSSLSLPSAPVYPPLCQFNFCWRCGVIKQGPWFDCEKCDNKLCVTCHATSTATKGDCLVGTGPHVWEERTCIYCAPTSAPAPAPAPALLRPVTSWGSLPLNSFGSPLLPSVPTMPPVASDETPLPSAPVPVAEPIGIETYRASNDRIIHHGVVCDACHSTIEGVRHKCLDCLDYDLCTSCVTDGWAERHNPFHEFFEIVQPGRVVVHNVFSGNGERDPLRHSEVPAPQSSQPVVHNATCNLCDSRICGDRYVCFSFIHLVHFSLYLTLIQKCLECPDFDTCNQCFTITEEHHPGHGFLKVSQLEAFIFRDKNTQAHPATCDSCSKHILGIRYKCMHQDCLDFDLCQDCEALPISVHPITHPLLKIRNVDTVIPAVYRSTTPNPVDRQFTVTVRGRPPSRQAASASPRPRSPSGSYESGYMRNPGTPADRFTSPEIPPPSPFYFGSQSSRSPSPEYQYRRVNRSPSPPYSIPTPGARTEPPARTPSPILMIPGAMPSFFTLPPIESLSLSPILRTPSEQDNVLPPLRRTSPVDVQAKVRAPSPLWKRMPYSRPHSPLIPGQYLADSQQFTARLPTPKPVCDYPVMAPVSPERNSPTPPPDWHRVYSSGSPVPVKLPPQTENTVPKTSHVLPSVRSSTTSSSFWPENFQEIRHLMEDEPSFSRDLRWSVARSVESQPTVEESPLIDEGEPLLTRPVLSDDSAHTDSVRSLASILNDTEISAANPFITSMGTKEQLSETHTAPTPAVVSLPSSSTEPLNAEFIADRSIPDGQIFAPGAEFLKAWVMRNGGHRTWPEGTELISVAGESLAKDHNATQVKLVGAVQPGEQIDVWTGELKAPEVPGRYISYYRLRDGEGNLFGHRIWIESVFFPCCLSATLIDVSSF